MEPDDLSSHNSGDDFPYPSGIEIRETALRLACGGGLGKTEAIVERATEFEKFLLGNKDTVV